MDISIQFHIQFQFIFLFAKLSSNSCFDSESCPFSISFRFSFANTLMMVDHSSSAAQHPHAMSFLNLRNYTNYTTASVNNRSRILKSWSRVFLQLVQNRNFNVAVAVEMTVLSHTSHLLLEMRKTSLIKMSSKLTWRTSPTLRLPSCMTSRSH